MQIFLREKQKVEVQFRGFSIMTDQPLLAGGDGSAPSPFDYFLASIGACAGFYVKSFCEQRGLSTEGIRLEQVMHRDPVKRMISKIEINIILPEGFPEKYREPVIKAAEACSVKKHIASAPEFSVNTINA